MKKIKLNNMQKSIMKRSFPNIRTSDVSYVVMNKNVVDVYNKKNEYLTSLGKDEYSKVKKLPESFYKGLLEQNKTTLVTIKPNRYRYTVKIDNVQGWYYLPAMSTKKAQNFFKNIGVKDYIEVSSHLLRGDTIELELNDSTLEALQNQFSGKVSANPFEKGKGTSSSLIKHIKSVWKI